MQHKMIFISTLVPASANIPHCYCMVKGASDNPISSGVERQCNNFCWVPLREFLKRSMRMQIMTFPLTYFNFFLLQHHPSITLQYIIYCLVQYITILTDRFTELWNSQYPNNCKKSGASLKQWAIVRWCHQCIFSIFDL